MHKRRLPTLLLSCAIGLIVSTSYAQTDRPRYSDAPATGFASGAEARLSETTTQPLPSMPAPVVAQPAAMDTHLPASQPMRETVRVNQRQFDPQVLPATNTQLNTTLPSPLEPVSLTPRGKEKTPALALRGAARPNGSSSSSIATVIGSLLIVVGLFLATAWVLRRAGPKSARTLPSEVIEVLGRTSLGPRHYLQLVRFGNKLVLLSLTSGHAETLSEITDDGEVGRLVGICSQKNKESSTASFDSLLHKMNNEQSGGILNQLRGKLATRSGQSGRDAEVDNAV